MHLQQPLTKENFWNEIMKKFPKATKVFCEWIDEYKKEVNWVHLFNQEQFLVPDQVKFHDIPHAMQEGIWIEFVRQNIHKFFEQPEYSYSMDLEEDIKTVFAELEPLIDEDGE